MKSNTFILLVLIWLANHSVLLGQPIPANVPVVNGSYDQVECSISLHPFNKEIQFVTFHDAFRDFYVKPGYAFTMDGGANWIPTSVPFLPGYGMASDPSCAIDRNGKAYYCYIATADRQSNDWHLLVSSTTDYGSQWNTQRIDEGLTNLPRQDKPYFAIDNRSSGGNLYVAWTPNLDENLTQTEIRLARSADGGAHWSSVLLDEASNSMAGDLLLALSTKPTIVSQSQNPSVAPLHFVEFAMPAVGPNGEVYVSWTDNFDYRPFPQVYESSWIKIAKSTDGGETFGPVQDVARFTFNEDHAGLMRIFTNPSLAVDERTGYVYLAYKDAKSDADRSPRIKLARSTDGGESWTVWNDVGEVNGSDPSSWQYFPWVSVEGSGIVSISYLHSQGDPRLQQTYVVHSVDFGESFSQPILISNTPSDPSGGVWSHEYLGMVSTSEDAFTVWSDYRSGALQGSADIYWAKIDLPPSQPQNVKLSSNSGTNGNIRVSWNQNPESDISSYEVSRNVIENGTGWQAIAITTNTYYVDPEYLYAPGAPSGNVHVSYRIRAKDAADQYSGYSDPATVRADEGGEIPELPKKGTVASPRTYRLAQNYPNPFNPTTSIRYELPRDTPVLLRLYDVLGREVMTLVDAQQESGYHSVTLDGSQLPSGIYFYRIQADEFSQVRALTLIR